MATLTCSFYHIDYDDLGAGLWSVENYYEDGFCEGWFDDNDYALSEDAPVWFARVVSVPAILASPFIFTSVLILSCITMSVIFIKIMAFTMFLLGLLCFLCLVRLLLGLLVLDMAWARVHSS
jgi:membrane-bound ClpP family serine protease